MVRKIRLLQCLLLSAVILSAAATKAEAFFLIPPMPWDIEVDIPGNANKVISNVKAAYREAQTIKSEWNTQKLEVLKKAKKFAETKFSSKNEKNKNKTPGKGKLKASAKLGITTDSLDEEEYFNAFNTLFLVYPPKSSYPDNYTAMKTAYAKKAKEYQQDMIIETYLTGRVTEDYLGLVEKTIDRLDRCQKGIYGEKTGDNCVFFGLKMAYVNPELTEDELQGSDDSSNPGQYGEMMNAYIVTTVYDRLMRIVEDLTAMEAQFVSSQQINMVEPIEPEEESSAADYIDSGYRFTYNDSREYAYADGTMLGGDYKRSTACAPGSTSKDCAGMNSDKAELLNTDDTAILGQLQPVDEQISLAINLHNLKAKLGDYKMQYRKYLKAKEIHERLLGVLTQSDKCVVSFLDKYSSGQGSQIWYGGQIPAVANEHDSRGGLSHTVIAEYQEDTTDTILGTSTGECDGYYTDCPQGYKKDDTEGNQSSCTTSGGETLYACVLDTVAADTEPESPTADYDQTTLPDRGYEAVAEESNLDYDDTDFLMDGTVADDIETENRIKAERNWLIGYNHIMDMTEDGTLQFEPWNDQKNLQEEYLRNKYRNMRMTVKMVDEGMMSYRVAAVQARKHSNPGAIEKILPAITACKLTTDATQDAWDKECSDYSGGCSVSGDTASCSGTKTIACTCYNSDGSYTCYKTLKCNISGSNDTGIISGSKEVGCSKTTQSIYYDQRITSLSGGCAFPKASTPYSAIEEKGSSCPGTWDFSTKFLVQRYMPAVVGSWINGGSYAGTCPGGLSGLDAQTEHLYQNAKAAGRKVASDYLKPVMEARKQAEETLQAMVEQYEKDMISLKSQLKSAIASRSTSSTNLDTATATKNDLIKDRQRTVEHVSGLIENLDELNNVRIPALKERLEGRTPKPKNLQKDLDALLTGAGEDLEKIENPTLADRIGKLPAIEEELKFLCSNAPDEIEECDEYRSSANKEDPYENVAEEDVFTNIAKLDTQIATAQAKMDRAQDMLDIQQEKIDSLSEKIRQTAEDFADTYLKKAEEMQAVIDEQNESFEKKLEPQNDGSDPARMESREWCSEKRAFGVFCKKHSKNYTYDNLSWTMARVLYSTVDSNDHDGVNDDSQVQSDLYGIVDSTIRKRWFEDGKWSQYPSKLAGYGVVRKFVVASGALNALGISNGVQTPETVAEQIREQAIKEAAQYLQQTYIPNADKTIKEEIDAAAEEISDVMDKWGVSGEDDAVPSEEIYEHTNYEDGGDIVGESAMSGKSPLVTEEHYALIEKLKQAINPSLMEEAGIKLSESFGIPENITTDNDYFVGLPARGLYTNTIPTFGKPVSELTPSADENTDSNNGRDYMAPHRPLLNLAPLREVFYFSALDYDDVPKKDNKPSRSTLVDKKYKHTTTESAETVEYLPETWRYLLATPNFRDNGQYQQTFVERSYGEDKLKDYINNADIPNAKEEHYRAIIGRAGVYPCKLGKKDNNGKIVDTVLNKIIDVGGGDGVGDMSFKQRSSIPSGATVQTCQEVAGFNSGLRHLLADHAEEESDSKALQGSLGSTSEPMYTNYSELGQFLNGNLEYRPMLRNIFDYLLDDNNQDNNIERQRADLATYKRNVIGSFLEAVNAEHNAEKTMDNNKEDVVAALESLCTQIHALGESIAGEELCEDTDDSECAETSASECAQLIMETGGLAKDASDDVYDVDCGSADSGSYYEQIYCRLGELEDEAIQKAKHGYTDEDTGTAYKGRETLEFNAGDEERVQERLTKMDNYFDALAVENAEVATIQPDETGATMVEAVKEALANRDALRAAEEEGLTSMDNQSQAAAYCPVY